MSSLAARAISLAPSPATPAAPLTLHRGRLDLAPSLLSSKRHVVELVAPAGYGKTTLLRSWHEQATRAGRRALWIALDEAERAPVGLLRRILGAWYETAAADIAIDSEAAGLDLLLSELGALEQGCVLLLDDVQVLAGSPALSTLEWILDNQPDGLTVVLASREQATLPLQARRLRGQLTRISAQDLAFTPAECASFLRERHRIALDAEQLDHLHRHTEGWAAALQLAALALGEAEDRPAFIREFGGSHRDVTDYLAETVLARLSASERQFLFRISVLDRLCADLCETLTGAADAQRRLEDIERRNLFLVALDAHREWFRFHSLFREFLRSRAHAEDADRARRDAEAAAQWCLQHGHREDAVQYALQAGRTEYAAGLIADYAEELVKYRGEHQRLVEWIGRLPAPVLAQHPRIGINHAWSLTFSYRFDEADATLDALTRTLQAGDAVQTERLRKEIRCARDLNRCLAVGLSDHVEAALVMSQQWLEEWPDATVQQLGPLHTVLAYAYKCSGDFAAAAKAVDEARRCFEQVGTPFGVAWIEFYNVLLLMRLGRYRAARASCCTAMTMSAERLGANSLMYSMHSALMAAIEFEMNHVAAAREALAQGLKFLEPHGSVDSILVAYVTLARMMAAEGRLVDACDLLQEGEATGRRRSALRLSITFAAERAALLLRNGQLDAAAELLKSEVMNPALGDGEYAGVIRDKRQRLEARLAIARGDVTVLDSLATLIRHARHRRQTRKLVELLLIRTAALQIAGRDNEALRGFTEALELAAPERMVRVVLDEGESLHPLIARLHASRDAASSAPADEAMQALLAELIATIRSDLAPRPTGPEADAGLREALTKRELQILRMIESGLSNKQLARTLFVSEGTLKWHLYNIYGKLDVRNRSGAIAKARRLHLL